jgi:hypothetical protein
VFAWIVDEQFIANGFIKQMPPIGDISSIRPLIYSFIAIIGHHFMPTIRYLRHVQQIMLKSLLFAIFILN